jgi:exosome complex component RRP4
MDLNDDQELFGSGGSKLTYPGESLTSSQAYMRYVGFAADVHSLIICFRGHGTYVENEEVVASVAGSVERVNKLVTVRPVRTR